MVTAQRPGWLHGRLTCVPCGVSMWVVVRGQDRWYTCACPRRINAADLDVTVLARVYDRRRELGVVGAVSLADEPAVVRGLVAAVRLGEDVTRPLIRWVGAAAEVPQ